MSNGLKWLELRTIEIGQSHCKQDIEQHGKPNQRANADPIPVSLRMESS